jgi:zinc and cadmium transporter
LESLAAVVVVQMLAGIAVLSLHRFDAWLRRALPYIISIAVGVLLATGAAHLLPEAVEALGNRPAVWVTLVVTMLALYSFERAFHVLSGVRAEPASKVDCHGVDEHGHHHHGHGHHASRPATLLLGSFMHSFVDGTSIAAAFAASLTLDHRIGWITALAVGLHEVPHRLGDFALLVHMGMHRTKAALFAIGAGASSLVGWGVVAALGAQGTQYVAWLLPVSAGSFLYIALVDLLPELQTEQRAPVVLGQIACLAAGVALVLALTQMRGA